LVCISTQENTAYSALLYGLWIEPVKKKGTMILGGGGFDEMYRYIAPL